MPDAQGERTLRVLGRWIQLVRDLRPEEHYGDLLTLLRKADDEETKAWKAPADAHGERWDHLLHLLERAQA